MYSDLEALEIEMDPDSDASGSRIADLPLPKDAVIGGILHKGKGVVPTGDTRLHARDRVVVLTLPAAIHGVESLFAS
jgi:trk system potassium uptake protein TrkA